MDSKRSLWYCSRERGFFLFHFDVIHVICSLLSEKCHMDFIHVVLILNLWVAEQKGMGNRISVDFGYDPTCTEVGGFFLLLCIVFSPLSKELLD